MDTIPWFIPIGATLITAAWLRFCWQRHVEVTGGDEPEVRAVGVAKSASAE